MARDFSPFEAVLEKLKRKERTPWGKLQGLSHRWLGYLEASPLLQAHRAFFKGFRAAPKLRPDPAIDLDSLFLFSVFLHLLLFLLLAQIPFRSEPSKSSGPILVRILEAEPLPRKEGARQAPKVAQPKAGRPRPAAEPAITPAQLPAPKELAEPAKETAPAFTPQAVEARARLPTRSEAGEATLATKVDPVPSRLGAGKAEREGFGREGARAPSALSSPDFGPYLEMIKKRVQSVWKYPEGIAGRHEVNVLFVLDRGGSLVRAEVLDSTDSKLNSGALEAMKRAAPFPPIPESLKELAGSPLRIRFNIDFGVRLTR